MATSPSITRKNRALDGAAPTEERLRNSAVKHFSAKGYTATSIRDIISDAGVTRPVLYYYYKNKEDLFTKLVQWEMDQTCAELDVAISNGATFKQKLVSIMSCSFRRAEESPEVVQMLLHFFFSPPDANVKLDRSELGQKRFQRVVSVMQNGIDDGAVGGGDASSLALVFSGIMDMHIMAKSRLSDGELTPALAEGLVDLFLLGASPGNSPLKPLKTPFDFGGTAAQPPID